ncbi:MAG: tRNA pseudouridine(13) synthase TruD [Porticoccus sp.]|nr:tRNA pseudouridine(13) synthase TruD [Porticoccus sp.]
MFRAEFEDFKVDEVLGFTFSGEGEHLCLHVEKRGENTRWIAKLLAEYFGVDEMAIGYCGLKDRRAISRQWFSVHLPNTPDVTLPNVLDLDALGSKDLNSKAPEYQVLESCRHNKKLRRGMHKANSFVIRLRQVQGDRDVLEGRLQQILEQGVPNYFGEQRFGIDGGNLSEADSLLRTQYGVDRIRDSNKKRGSGKKGSRGKRGSPLGGIYLSAARSYLFNLVLAEHVKQGSWSDPIYGRAVEGDAVESDTVENIIATGPMWGRGRSNAPETVCEFEKLVLSDWQDWTNAMEFSGLQQERRSLVLNPEGFSWKWLPSATDLVEDLELSFSLPSGCFATSVLRELIQLKSPAPELVA